MRYWLTELLREFRFVWDKLLDVFITPSGKREHPILKWSLISGFAILFTALVIIAIFRPELPFDIPILYEPPPPPPPDYTKPVREIPPPFKRNQKMPAIREGTASLSIDRVNFDPDRDIIHVDDDRVWWESEHDHGDTEDDHEMHRAMEDAFRRVVELVDARGAKLKVQDAYRAKGIHAPRSLHKQGRGIDLTAEGLTLGELAALCWAAGFDWVYNEWPRKGGAHVHASVRPD